MIQKLVSTALKMPAFVCVLALCIAGAGVYCYKLLNIEAYPNPVPPMVEVISQPEGWSPEEVERFVTIPLETAFAGMPGLDHIRSQSLFELSDIKCYFKRGTDYIRARQEVLNRIHMAEVPDSVKSSISPWSPIGEVYRYVLRGRGYTLQDLKTAQDWIVEKQLKRVQGVVGVTGFGGFTKQYHVEIDPNRLRAYGLSLSSVTQAIANANRNVGGQYISLGEQSFNVRGIGLIQSLRDIRHIVVAEVKGTPIRVRDIANVNVGPATRLGIVGKDQEADVVQGVVLMYPGGDTMKTLEGIHERVEYIRKYHLLPPGMDIDPVYDRANLVKLTTHTVIENLILGMLLVSLVLWGFLGHGRAALITALNIPLALLISFIGIVTTGTSANLISLGAVDFGIVVESTVIMMENIFRHLGKKGNVAPIERIRDAAREVGPPILSSTLIIAVAFIPLFTLTGVAGVIFSPMAHTYAYAIGGAIILALTLTPVLAMVALHIKPSERDDEHEHDNWLMRALNKFYLPLFDLVLRRKKMAVIIGLAPVALALVLLTRLGGEFMPKLEEGNFYIRATLPTSISLAQAATYVGRMREIVLGCPEKPGVKCDLRHRAFPEVRLVISQVGRPDDGTDVSGFNNIELLAPLKPGDEWRKGVTKTQLTEALSGRLKDAFPGVIFNFSQAISDNVAEAVSGVKGENTVKVIGPDLRVNENKAREVVSILGSVPGVQDLGLFRTLGQPGIRITPDRIQCGRYGLNVGDVESIVQAAIGGEAITQVYEGEKHFDLTVRWAEPFRKDLRAIRNILVSTPDGNQIPLSQLAQIIEEEGPIVIYREDNNRYTPVKFSVRGRDLTSAISEAQRRVDAKVTLPYDTHLEWAGEIDQLHEATSRLAVVIPITLLLIAFLVFSAVKNWVDTAIVLLGIPVAATGGILALFVTGTNFSISAAMGFVSIFGIAVQDALIVVTNAQRLWKTGIGLEESVRLAAERCLRPVLMTTFVAMFGLLPAALSHGIGSETQKFLAIVVIGGALTMAILPRVLQPPLLVLGHTLFPKAHRKSVDIEA